MLNSRQCEIVRCMRRGGFSILDISRLRSHSWNDVVEALRESEDYDANEEEFLAKRLLMKTPRGRTRKEHERIVRSSFAAH